MTVLRDTQGREWKSRDDYVYDPDGNRLAMTEVNAAPACRAAAPNWASPKTTAYSYDAYDLLEKVNYPDGRAVVYTYDEVGNRLSEVETRDDFTAVKNRAFLYDADNRLRWVDDHLVPAHDRSTAYQYNASGDTMAKIIGVVDPAANGRLSDLVGWSCRALETTRGREGAFRGAWEAAQEDRKAQVS